MTHVGAQPAPEVGMGPYFPHVPLELPDIPQWLCVT